MSRCDGDHFGMLYVLSLENGGEDEERFELSGAEQDDRGNGAFGVQAVLRRGDIHAAAVVATVHGRGKPDLFVGLGDAVNGDGCGGGLVVEQQSLDGDAGVVDGLVGFFRQLVADLTAVAVNAVADAIEEPVALSVDGYGGKVPDVFGEGNESCFGGGNILAEVVPAAHGVVEEILRVGQVGCEIDEFVQGTVPAGNHQLVIFADACEKFRIILDFADVAEIQLPVTEQLMQSLGAVKAFSAAGERVVENVNHIGSPSFCL